MINNGADGIPLRSTFLPASIGLATADTLLRVEVNSDDVSKDTDDVVNTRSYKDTLMGVAATG
jgi:hypothetical protein